ncbi:MAG: hypothetical protein ACKVS7_08455 [Gemmatimonadaceae bacterium]
MHAIGAHTCKLFRRDPPIGADMRLRRYCRQRAVASLALTIAIVLGCSKEESDRRAQPSAASDDASASIQEGRVEEGLPVDLVTRSIALDSALDARAGVLGFDPQMRPKSFAKAATLWSTGARLLVAFPEGRGSPDLRRKIVEVASEWSQFGNVTFDFYVDRDRQTFREWSVLDQQYRAHIRIDFIRSGRNAGYWSVLGNRAVSNSVVPPGRPSLNLGGFVEDLPRDWASVVRHEFGHALGLQHEHQHPSSTCESEFRFEPEPGYRETRNSRGTVVPDQAGKSPGLYRYLGSPPNEWERDRVDSNIRRLLYSRGDVPGGYDERSIMKYSFLPWLFIGGTAARCFTRDPELLSVGDQQAMRRLYPAGAREWDQLALFEIRTFNLNATQSARLLGVYREQRDSLVSIEASITMSAPPNGRVP